VSGTSETAGSEGDSSATVNIYVGTGNKIGLANDINLVSDVYAVNEAGSRVTAVVNTTHDTIDFVTDGDGSNDYDVWYRAYSVN
jgi:hypothetical protein